MRDINRLDDFYNELKFLHKKYFPDWRFGQMLMNFQHWCYLVKKISDIFYLEEDEFLFYFNKYIEEKQN